MKTLVLLLLPFLAIGQDTTALCNSSEGFRVSGDFSGYVGANFIVIDSAYVHDADLYATRFFVIESTIDSSATLHVINCQENAKGCADHFIPGIAVLGDSAIRDDEWESGGYADVLTDSASFFTMDAMMLYQKFGIYAADDCGVDSFYLKELEIVPPGSVDRPPGGTREFRMLYRAVDFAGRSKEALQIWIRNEN